MLDKSDLQGHWQIVSAEITIDGETLSVLGEGSKMVKIIAENEFSFFSKQIERARFANPEPTDAEILNAYNSFGAAYGKYTLKGDQYTEEIEYCSHPNYEDQSITFKVSIQDDLLVQEGQYPRVRLGLGDKDGYLVEKYKRVG